MRELFAGVDLGGTALKAAVSDSNGALIASESVETQSHLGPEGVIARIVDLVRGLVAGQSGSMQGLGVGVPGLVDLNAGVTKFLPNLPTQWRDVPLAQRLGGQLACPVRLLNDVRTATLGELTYGHGSDRPSPTMALISIGTGIGGGVVIDGVLRLGPLGSAGELGHQTIVPDGPRCGCGNRGCLEAVASGPAIAAQGVKLMRMGLAPGLHERVGGDANRVTTEAMSMAAKEDRCIGEAIEQAAVYIGIAAANLVTILHPDLIVLAGGVSQLGQPLVDTVRREITARVGMFPTQDVEVMSSKLGDQAGVMGAIVLAKTAGQQQQQQQQ